MDTDRTGYHHPTSFPSLKRPSLTASEKESARESVKAAHRQPSFTRYEVVNDLTVGKELPGARERLLLEETLRRCRIPSTA